MKIDIDHLKEAIASPCTCRLMHLGKCSGCLLKEKAAAAYLDLMTPHTEHNATFLPGLNNANDYNPDTILKMALGYLNEVVVVGTDKNGKEFFSTSLGHFGPATWHLQRGLHRLMLMTDAWKK